MKKLFVMVMCLVFAASLLAGCSNGNVEETGSDDEYIVIGGINDLTGNRSVTGNAINNGAILAMEEINAAGGVLGKQIKFVSYDNKNDSQESINAYSRLVDVDKASAVLATDASSICMSLIEISTEKKVPICGLPSDPRAVMDVEGTGEAYPYMFLTGQCNAPQQAVIVANYLNENTDLKKAALFYDQSNAYAVAIIEGFTQAWEGFGNEITIVETCNATDQDFTTQLSKIKNSGAEFIYTPNPTAQLTIMVQQADQLGLDIPYAGCQDMADPFLSLLDDPSVVGKSYFQSSVYMEDPRLTTFCQDYEARFGDAATIKAVNGYDIMYIIAAAIEAAGSADPEAIKVALENNIVDLELLCSENYSQDGKTHSPAGLGMAVYEITDGVMEYKGYTYP